MMKQQEFTKYEVARIIGARALQISMDAPLLLNMDKETLERLKYDSISIADMEFNSGVLPITVKRPMPKKRHVELKQKPKVEKTEEEKKKEEEKIEQEKIVKEKEEEKEISEEGEIMGLAKPEDEVEEEPEEESATEEA